MVSSNLPSNDIIYLNVIYMIKSNMKTCKPLFQKSYRKNPFRIYALIINNGCVEEHFLDLMLEYELIITSPGGLFPIDAE